MGEKVTAKQRLYRSFSNIEDKLLTVLQNKKDCFKLSDENKTELKRDVKIYGRALVISAVALALLNFLWWLFAKIGFGFFSPLDHQEGLQMIVDVTCAVVIAVATIRLEYRWRQQDYIKRQSEENQHKQELISDRIRELNSNDLRAIGYAVTNTSGFFCDFLHHYNEGIASADFVMAIVPFDSHKSLIPAHFNLANESLKVNEFKICGVNCNDESQLHCSLFHDMFLVWTDSLLDNKSKKALFKFLSNVLYIKQERERQTIEISFSVTLTEFLSTDENIIPIPYEVSLILYPVSSFTNRGTFDCQVIYN